MDLRKVVEAEPSLKGTVFEDLFEIMQDGKFAEVGEPEPVKPGEEVIGEMNKLERALYTMSCKYGEIVESFAARAEEACKKCACKDEDKAACTLSREHDLSANRFETVRKLMWGCIKQRLSEKDKSGSSAMAIRTGGQIVLVFKNEDDPRHNLLGALFLRGLL